jgi:hypothetical protein
MVTIGLDEKPEFILRYYLYRLILKKTLILIDFNSKMAG